MTSNNLMNFPAYNYPDDCQCGLLIYDLDNNKMWHKNPIATFY